MNNANEYVLTFGKHKDKSLGNILECDPQYLVWLAGICTTHTMKRASRDALAKVKEEHGDTCVKMAKQVLEGKCFRCAASNCTCISKVGRQYQYHPYGKRE